MYVNPGAQLMVQNTNLHTAQVTCDNNAQLLLQNTVVVSLHACASFLSFMRLLVLPPLCRPSHPTSWALPPQWPSFTKGNQTCANFLLSCSCNSCRCVLQHHAVPAEPDLQH